MRTKKAERTPTSDARFRQILVRYQELEDVRKTPDDTAYKHKEARAITLLENSVIDWINDVWKT
jgi:hypothetical protein